MPAFDPGPALAGRAHAPQLIGHAPAFEAVLGLIERVARFDAPVLIEGETGTGKELAARAIHYGSARRDAAFVPLNCGAIPDTLIESELFGCERGAFTDARQSRVGLVAAAEGGTLFLDELDSLSLRAQVVLLRFLQDHTYRAVGGTREVPGHLRVLAAASPRLQQRLQNGDFRDDLLFRLGVLQIKMPPLRERVGDATLLAEHFVARHARQHGITTPRRLSAASVNWLESYSWPGNVRELDNCIQRALLLGDGPWLELGHAAAPTVAAARESPDPSTLPNFNAARDIALHRFERDYLDHLMRVALGNVTKAAQLAGKERRCLGKLLKKHGLDGSRYQGAANG